MASRPIIFGDINGVSEGKWFKDRREMMPTSFHRIWARGIDGNRTTGASAIVLSGGYEDDEDLGDELIYTGAGGNDSNSKQQIEDQSWEHNDNAALLKSWDDGLPIRVIRGYKHKSPLSPKTGYTYAGLYGIVDTWKQSGKSGYKICRFKLQKLNNKSDYSKIDNHLDHSTKEKKRIRTTVLRVVRDSTLATSLKELYNHECQVCGTRIPTKTGFYAEGAHIKPLGRPHNGDDSLTNLICLCPNHHVMFDKGVISVRNDMSLVGAVEGVLDVNEKHQINLDNFEYHRSCHGFD